MGCGGGEGLKNEGGGRVQERGSGRGSERVLISYDLPAEPNYHSAARLSVRPPPLQPRHHRHHHPHPHHRLRRRHRRRHRD